MAAGAQGPVRRRSPASASSTEYRLLLWFLIGGGFAGRLILAFTTPGQRYDLGSYAAVNSALHAHVFGIYHQLDNSPVAPYGRWPYPPGFFAAIVPLASLAHHTGLAVTSVIRIPAIVSDCVIAWLVQDFLGRRGFSEVARLLGASLVAIGPSFVAISGYHGQFDAVAILPAVAALILWTRSDAPSRAVWAGALIGAGAALKTVPLVMLIPLLPSARSWREAVKLVVPALAIPLVALAPWLILDGPGKSLVFTYRGGPGLGGLSLLADPRLPTAAFGLSHDTVHGLTRTLYDNARWITGTALLAVTLFLLRYRPSPVQGAVLVWLAVWAFGVSFFLQYLVWGLPFLLLAGYLREALLLEAAVLLPTIVTYAAGVHAWQVWAFYTVPMILLWVAWVAAALLLGRVIVRQGDIRRGAGARMTQLA